MNQGKKVLIKVCFNNDSFLNRLLLLPVQILLDFSNEKKKIWISKDYGYKIDHSDIAVFLFIFSALLYSGRK